jgi:hypothetical protein
VGGVPIGKRVRRTRATAVRWVRRVHLAYGVSDAVAHVLGREVVTVLGDSHARAFYAVREERLVPKTWFDIVFVRGATARGLANPNSKTNALERFERALRTVPHARKTLVMLGEVDCGFLIWFRAEAGDTSVADEFEQSVRHYQDFVAELVASGRHRLALVSAPVPTVDDYATWEGLANQRRMVRAGIEERTELTVAFNQRMKAWTTEHGCAYLDLDGAVVDPATGRVRDEYRNPDPLDHHLSREPFVRLLARRLADLEWPTA